MRKNITASKARPTKNQVPAKSTKAVCHDDADENRMVRIDARIPSHVKEIVRYAANLQGRSQTDFMVTAIHEAAQKVIADNSVIRLCIEDQKELAAALHAEKTFPETKGLARLRRAIREHGKKVASS